MYFILLDEHYLQSGFITYLSYFLYSHVYLYHSTYFFLGYICDACKSAPATLHRFLCSCITLRNEQCISPLKETVTLHWNGSHELLQSQSVPHVQYLHYFQTGSHDSWGILVCIELQKVSINDRYDCCYIWSVVLVLS